MTNPFPVPHKKEWADLGPYRAQVNAATRASEAAMAKKGRKGGKPKLFARSTDLVARSKGAEARRREAVQSCWFAGAGTSIGPERRGRRGAARGDTLKILRG